MAFLRGGGLWPKVLQDKTMKNRKEERKKDNLPV